MPEVIWTAHHTSVKFLCFTHKWDVTFANPAFYKVSERKVELELMHVYVLISIWSLKRFPRVCEAREARLNTDRFATEGGVEVGRGSEEGCWGCVWGDGIKAHQLHDLVKEDQRLERELHADSKVGEGLSDWDCKICQRHNHKAAKKLILQKRRGCAWCCRKAGDGGKKWRAK